MKWSEMELNQTKWKEMELDEPKWNAVILQIGLKRAPLQVHNFFGNVA